jgi:two-component system LytT family response regulator
MRALSDRGTRRIACRVGNSTSFVTTEEVQYFRADQGYTLVKAVGRELLVDTPLVELETRLDPADFVRIHRNTLVNLNHVASLKRLDGGGMTITLKDGTELSSSRRYAENLRNLL